MLQDQCISITDLRTETKKCLEGLEKHEKYVFVNNRPTAVIVGVKIYETMREQLKQTYQLIEMNSKDISPRLKAKIAETKKMDLSELIDI